MHKIFAGLAIVGFAIMLTAGAASAVTDTTTHYTDGTGPVQGGTDYGPPPLAVAWQPGHECEIALVDPPNPVYVTIHDSSGSFLVVQYVGQTPGTFPADVSSLVAGHAGVLTTTWNIGTGVSAPFSYDCRVPETTTTTVEPVTTTTAQPAVDTTTSTEPGTPITTSVSSVPPAPGAPPDELPHTGAGDGLLALAGISLLVGGGALAWKFGRDR